MIPSQAQEPNMRPDTYITTGEAARLLGVSPKTVTRWASEGRILHQLTLGGHRRYSLRAVLAIRDLRQGISSST